jgi:hypothetical protein
MPRREFPRRRWEGDRKMRRQIAAALCAAALGLAASYSLAIARQKTTTPATPVPHASNGVTDRQVYSTIKDLMESIVDPSADALWGAVGTIVDKGGVQEMLPKTQEEWLDLRRAAIRIIEGSNLLMMPGREAAPAGTKSETPGVELEPPQITALIRKKRKDFDGFAKALQLLGLEALRATEAKNAALLEDIGGRMENVCEGCHQTFWYPQ